MATIWSEAMKLLNRYIGRSILITTLGAVLVFLGLQFFIALLSELTDIGSGNYTLWQALVYVILATPSQFYMLFPMVALLGALIGLGLLASTNELLVMRSSGVSITRIALAVMGVAVIIMLVVTFIGEGVGPYLQQKADMRKDSLQNSGQALVTQRGIWMRQGRQFIHIDAVITPSHLNGVTVYQFNQQHRLISASTAKHVNYEDKQWVMYDVAESLISDTRIQSKRIKKLPWHVKISPTMFNITALDDPNEMNLVELWQNIEFRSENGLSTSGYQLNFWKRIYQPLATLVMIFLAIPFVFGSLRSKTMGFRLMLGIIVGLAFYLANQFLGQLSLVLQIPAYFAALSPIVIFFLIGLLLSYRAK
jgi:lipopolysaccharide export system permease protein